MANRLSDDRRTDTPRAPLALQGPARVGRFVVVPENRSAAVAARRVLRALARRDAGRPTAAPPHPLTLHGPPGVGKSHLVAALVARIGPSLSAVVLPAAEVRPPDAAGKREDEWLAPLRDCDLLVVEDVQHLSDRGTAPLAALLDHRAARRLPVVLTASAGPGQLANLPGRLASRLAGGLVVGLEPLGTAARRRVARSMLRERRLTVEPAVLDWLAARPGGGLRPVLGAVHQVEAAAKVSPPPLTLAAVLKVAGESGATEAGADRLEEIARRVGRHFRVEWRKLRGTDRRHAHLWPRQVVMYLGRRLTGLSLARIGAWFGGRDHTTVLHACRKVEERMAGDGDLAGVVRRLTAELG